MFYSLVLASSSPRRAQLLQSAGIPFTLAPSPFEEPLPDASDNRHPFRFARHLAQGKALACDWDKLPSLPGEPLILAADTIVCHDFQILGKPRDTDEAQAMLQRLCGQTHHVITAVCLLRKKDAQLDWQLEAESTLVRFHERDADWIARYVASGEPMDKSGAYGAQGKGSFLLSHIRGDFSNVVGLPLGLLGRMFDEWKINYQNWWDNEKK